MGNIEKKFKVIENENERLKFDEGIIKGVLELESNRILVALSKYDHLKIINVKTMTEI